MRNFDLDALTWDENPEWLNMSLSVFASFAKIIPLTGDMDLLDFGCGTGLISYQALPHVRSVLCADTSYRMIDMVEKKIKSVDLDNIKTVLISPDDTASFPGSFDCIVSSMTFHHIQNVPLILSRLYPSVKQGGSICIADLDSDNGLFHDNSYGIFHNGFNRSVMTNYLEGAGFRNIRIETACTVTKQLSGGDQEFSIFIAAAQR